MKDEKKITILRFEEYKRYFESFANQDSDMVTLVYENALAFLQQNIPLFDCPDKEIELTYYFRWWNYHKHIKKTQVGYIVTEFLDPVSWALQYNAIAYPFYHQLLDGRWLRDPHYLDQYEGFWLTQGIGEWNVSAWKWPVPICQAIYDRALVKGNFEGATILLPAMIQWMEEVDRLKRHSTGLMWSSDNGEGEVSVSGGGFRPAMNAYSYANMKAISKIAQLAGESTLAEAYESRASELKSLINNVLWDEKDCFYKTLPLPFGELRELPPQIREQKNILKAYSFDTVSETRNAREWSGYLPWCFHIPPDDEKHAQAWPQLDDPSGFFAPYGLTTVEQRHPGFQISYEGHMCQWNGPSWPFATSLMLRAMGVGIRDYKNTPLTKEHFWRHFITYARAHRRVDENGRQIPWIDENLNPFTGEWLSREILKQRGWPKADGQVERGRSYNHSHYIDLVLTGLVGLVPRPDEYIEINPLLPPGKWRYFCLDGLRYHDHDLRILYDQNGEHYHMGSGFSLWIDGIKVAQHAELSRLCVNMSEFEDKID